MTKVQKNKSINVITTNVIENTWIVFSTLESVNSIVKKLKGGSYFIQTTDADKEYALVIDQTGENLRVVAKLKDSGGGGSCKVNYKAGN